MKQAIMEQPLLSEYDDRADQPPSAQKMEKQRRIFFKLTL